MSTYKVEMKKGAKSPKNPALVYFPTISVNISGAVDVALGYDTQDDAIAALKTKLSQNGNPGDDIEWRGTSYTTVATVIAQITADKKLWV